MSFPPNLNPLKIIFSHFHKAVNVYSVPGININALVRLSFNSYIFNHDEDFPGLYRGIKNTHI